MSFKCCIQREDNISWCGKAAFEGTFETVDDYLKATSGLFVACDLCTLAIMDIIEHRLELRPGYPPGL